MHFGRTDTGNTNYSLAEDHKSLLKVLGETKTAKPKVYVGGVLWAHESFKGLIYPVDAKAADYVKHYTQQFNTIELNSTHYRVPGPDTFNHWKNTAPQGFKFCPKINQAISHAENLVSMIGYHNECNHLFEFLEEKLGTCFMQLPPHFLPKRLNELMEFLNNSELQNLAIELRHGTWFRSEAELNLLCNYLYKNNMALVITDTPGRRDVLHMRLTNKTAFIRFNAINDENIDQQRVEDWILRAKTWFDSGLEEFYFFIHSTDQVHMPSLVSYFIRKLEEICGIKLSPPAIYKKDEPGELL